MIDPRLGLGFTIALVFRVAAATAQPSPLASFFTTSAGNGASGGNYGGLAGADARCQTLASAATLGGTWRAYLSTAPIESVGTLVNARDRIGDGPWFNVDGVAVADDLDALHQNGLAPAVVLDEFGESVPASEHDIPTGSATDGSALTEFPDNPLAPPPNCVNWTSNSANDFVWVGHADVQNQWNSQHATQCDQAGLMATLGSGRLYCFREDAVLADFDVDGDGETQPLTDGLLFLRYLFGFRGSVLITGAVGQGCTRCDALSIEAHIEPHV